MYPKKPNALPYHRLLYGEITFRIAPGMSFARNSPHGKEAYCHVVVIQDRDAVVIDCGNLAKAKGVSPPTRGGLTQFVPMCRSGTVENTMGRIPYKLGRKGVFHSGPHRYLAKPIHTEIDTGDSPPIRDGTRRIRSDHAQSLVHRGATDDDVGRSVLIRDGTPRNAVDEDMGSRPPIRDGTRCIRSDHAQSLVHRGATDNDVGRSVSIRDGTPYNSEEKDTGKLCLYILTT